MPAWYLQGHQAELLLNCSFPSPHPRLSFSIYLVPVMFLHVLLLDSVISPSILCLAAWLPLDWQCNCWPGPQTAPLLLLYCSRCSSRGGESALWPDVCVLFTEYVSWKSWGSCPLAGRASGGKLSPSIRQSSSPTRKI